MMTEEPEQTPVEEIEAALDEDAYALVTLSHDRTVFKDGDPVSVIVAPANWPGLA